MKRKHRRQIQHIKRNIWNRLPRFIKEEVQYRKLCREWEEAYRYPQNNDDPTRNGVCTDFVRAQDEYEEMRALLTEDAEEIDAWLNSGSDAPLRLERRTGFRPEQRQASMTAHARHGSTMLCKYLEINVVMYLVKERSEEKGYRISDIFCSVERYLRKYNVGGERR